MPEERTWKAKWPKIIYAKLAQNSLKVAHNYRPLALQNLKVETQKGVREELQESKIPSDSHGSQVPTPTATT